MGRGVATGLLGNTVVVLLEGDGGESLGKPVLGVLDCYYYLLQERTDVCYGGHVWGWGCFVEF